MRDSLFSNIFYEDKTFLIISEFQNLKKLLLKYQPFLRKEICAFTAECSACISQVCSEQPEGSLHPHLMNRDIVIILSVNKMFKKIKYNTNFLQLAGVA